MAEFSDPKHLAVKQAPAQRNAAANWGMPQFAGADGPPELNPGLEGRDTSKPALDSSLDKQYQPNALLTNPKGGKYAESKENPALVEALVALEPRPPGYKYKTSFSGQPTDKPLETAAKETTPLPPVQTNVSPVLGADGLALQEPEGKEGEKETLDTAGEKNTTAGAPDAPAGDSPKVAVVATPAIVAGEPEEKTEEKAEAGPEKLEPAPELSAGGEGMDGGGKGGPRKGMENPIEALGLASANAAKTPRKAPVLDSGSSGAVVESIASQQGLDIVRGLEQRGKVLPKAQAADRKATEAAMPGMESPTGLPSKRGKNKKGGNSKVGSGAKPKVKQPKGGKPKAIPVEHKAPATLGFWDRYTKPGKGWQAPAKSNKEQSETVGALSQLIHSNATPQVDTYIGPRPKVPLDGESDPALAKENRALARANTDVELQRQQVATRQDFGDADILPEVPVKTLKHKAKLSKPKVVAKGANRLRDVDPAHEGLLGAHAEVLLRTEADRSALEGRKAESDFEAERERHIGEGHAAIAQEEAATQGRQIGRKRDNSRKVAKLKEEWQLQNEGVMSNFDKQAELEWDKLNKDVDQVSTSTDAEVAAKLTKEEQEAAKAQKDAEERVRKRREEAKKKEAEKSWFDRAVDSVKSFFAELKAFVSKVFEDLRAWVKEKFEAAKKWVADKIEQARKLIVGAIQWFGDKLKDFVDVAFAAFPNIRDKFKGWIDTAVDTTVDFVNEQAAALTKFTQDMLDSVAGMVDGALGIMEDMTIGLLDGLEMVAVGAIQAAEYFYNLLLDKILKVATLVAFVALIASGFLLGWMWDFLGRDAKEYLVDLLFDIGIWVFENAPDDMRFGVLWPLFVHMMIGFMYEADSTPMEQKMKIMDKIADIVTFQDTDFVWNFVINIFVGIVENIWGIITGIYDLIMFVTRDMWDLIDQVTAWIKQVGPEIADAFSKLGIDLKNESGNFKKEGPDGLADILNSKNLNKVLEFLEGLGDSLRVQAEVMGARMAMSMRDFMMSDAASAVIGEQLGKLVGNLIVEIVLAVFTFGAGTAVKAGLRVVAWMGEFAGWLAKFGKAGRALAKVIQFLSKGMKWLVEAFEKIAAKWEQINEKVMAKFKEIFAKFGDRINEIIAKLMGKADDVPGGNAHVPDGPDVGGHHGTGPDMPDGNSHHGPVDGNGPMDEASVVDDGKPFKPKEDADGVVDTDNVDPDAAKQRKGTGEKEKDLVFAIAEAKAMLALMEGHMLAGLASEAVLKALKPKYRWIVDVRAERDGPNNFDIALIGSYYKIYNDFGQPVGLQEIVNDGNQSARVTNRFDDGTVEITLGDGSVVRGQQIPTNQVQTTSVPGGYAGTTSKRRQVQADDGTWYNLPFVNEHGVLEDNLIVLPSGRFGPNASKYAGKEFPLPDHLREKYGDNVRFFDDGTVDFESVLQENGIDYVKLEDFAMTGNSNLDIANANEIVFNVRSSQPGFEDWTWHHNHDGSMILIPSDLHNYVKHLGGDALTRAGLGQ